MNVSRFPLVVALAALSVFAVGSKAQAQSDAKQQYVEVRTYHLGDNGDAKAVDQYLSMALLPALNRQGIRPVGVFTQAPADKNEQKIVVVTIPYDSADQMTKVAMELQGDKRYQADAESYLNREPRDAPFSRISSELLVGMKCWPEVTVDKNVLENKDRVYELRLYESANERRGNLKVEMFNNGEVPIFLDCGITPIFIGQALIGPQTPNLTYLTVYPNEEARGKAWDAFRVHPDWQVLKKVAKYKGTVSKIDLFVLQPAAYSQM